MIPDNKEKPWTPKYSYWFHKDTDFWFQAQTLNQGQWTHQFDIPAASRRRAVSLFTATPTYKNVIKPMKRVWRIIRGRSTQSG